jgi:DNA helicase II / ATP-dependent DNA helicase PcrA
VSHVTDMPLFAARPDAEILEGLTPEQEAAVTHGDGPLLIVAGAGTGKTRVITRRIAWLIATKRARPEEILALTFTEKAAAEMETRVDELVPYGYVGSMICTFHAFGDGMLREHAVELGLTTQLRVESDAEMLVFLREHLFELGLERYLPLGRPDEHLRALLKLFDRARDEDVTPDGYHAFAEGLEATASTDAERDRAETELEKARAYAAYQKLILEHGRIDFGAQISLALRLLRERPYLRREYEDRYRYILVDEFQDTNHVQFELLKLLAGNRRNITVVGDDDQSIYRFRGAKVENLLGFIETFRADTLVLKHNYRSGQKVLDVAYRLIQHNNPQRLEAIQKLDKRLMSQRPGPGEVEHRSYRTMSDEVDGVVAEIEKLMAAGTEPGDIAVLARAHSNLEPYAVALTSRGIRFQRSSTRGLYSRPEV